VAKEDKEDKEDKVDNKEMEDKMDKAIFQVKMLTKVYPVEIEAVVIM